MDLHSFTHLILLIRVCSSKTLVLLLWVNSLIPLKPLGSLKKMGEEPKEQNPDVLISFLNKYHCLHSLTLLWRVLAIFKWYIEKYFFFSCALIPPQLRNLLINFPLIYSLKITYFLAMSLPWYEGSLQARYLLAAHFEYSENLWVVLKMMVLSFEWGQAPLRQW